MAYLCLLSPALDLSLFRALLPATPGGVCVCVWTGGVHPMGSHHSPQGHRARILKLFRPEISDPLKQERKSSVRNQETEELKDLPTLLSLLPLQLKMSAQGGREEPRIE